MKIALIGYGKMGKAIEEIAMHKGHEIVLKISQVNLADFNKENLQQADIAIEFTGPHSAFENVMKCIEWNVPVVCGSTGWLERYHEVVKSVEQHQGSFLYASNFSVGVNIFFEINKKLAQLMAHRPDYDVSIKEIHHTAKKDAPSGTAISLAEQVMQQIDRKKRWVNKATGNKADLFIFSERTDPAPGTHHVKYHSAIDDIEIIHTAHNRMGFAAGAVMAAEFIVDKKGVYSMKDVLGL